jgi:protein gp37
MPGDSTIEWTEATWNPVTGCTKVSPGCAHCYAETFAERWRGIPGHPYEQGFDLRLWPERLEVPVRWKRPRMIFVNSMSDLFHEDIPTAFVDRVFDSMRRAPQHTFQVLTKRPERMRDYLLERSEPAACVYAPWWPLPNVWLGTSIENRRFVGRADVLRETPAAVRFISAEPLLGPLVMLGDSWVGPDLDLDGVDWLIVGGESGPGHRPIRAEWVRDLRNYAVCSGTAFFFKQWGGRTPKAGGRKLDGRTWDEFPAVRWAVAE